MKNIIFTTLALAAWVTLFSQQIESSFIFSENSSRISDDNELTIISVNPADFQEFLIEWSETAHCQGMSVGILKNGDLYWKSHLGMANIAQNKPVTDSSCFYSASISKTITQTAILQLYEQGYFELEDNINDNLPFTIVNPNYPDSIITYYQLMTHTSSIRDNWTILEQHTVWGEDSPIPLGDFLQGYLIPGGLYYNSTNWYSNHPPGTYFDYSDVGNSVLGYLTESISGQELDDYCQDFIFGPLGINNASFFLSGMDTSNLATPYQYQGGSYIPWSQPGHPFYPAASLKISAVELSKFLGMYIKNGTFNGNTILNPETIELTTTPVVPGLYFPDGTQMCLTWLYHEDVDLTYHAGRWYPFSRTVFGYDKDDKWGIIFLGNSFVVNTNLGALISEMVDFAKHYKPLLIEHISVTETDGDQVIEPGEELSLGFTIQNFVNFPEILENTSATISVNNPYISLLSDSVCNLGTVNYLDDIQIPDDQFVFEVNEYLEPGDAEFQLILSWDEGVGYTIPFNLFAGNGEVVLIRDEDSENSTENWYLHSLDSLGYTTNFYDLGIREDITVEFINKFPAVIWFTGADEENTLSEYNQTILEGYLDNGGQLFLSGQDISDELAGSNFLENYLYTEHIQDTWYGNKTIKGIENDPIGNGQIYQLHQGDGITLDPHSMSVIEPLAGAYKSFGYYPPLDGAAVRYENDTYKTIFFAFGFEAINGFNNRTEILERILNDYFIMPHPCLPEGITFTTQEEIDNFQTNYPYCTEIEGDVEIDGGNITNLNGLNALSNINGDLLIGRVNQPFGGNDNLTNLVGLGTLNSIGGDLWISSNEALTSLTGLENLTSIGGHLIVIWNDKLINLTGLENLSSIEGDVYIGVIPMFPSPGCGNNSLTSLAGLENLISIGGSLGIYRNDTLTSLSGLVNLTSIGDELEIRGNNALTSLTGLDNIEAGTISHLSIVENQFLSTCQVQSICDYLIVYGGNGEIHDNAPSCNSQQIVEDICNGVSIDELVNVSFQQTSKFPPMEVTLSSPVKLNREGLPPQHHLPYFPIYMAPSIEIMFSRPVKFVKVSLSAKRMSPPIEVTLSSPDKLDKLPLFKITRSPTIEVIFSREFKLNKDGFLTV